MFSLSKLISTLFAITMFGQSGGGAKVLALMTSPYAEGLFDKGIVQSGATETMGVVFNSQEASTALTENILEILGITGENIEDIQTVPVDELQAAASQALRQTGEELQIPASLGGGYSMDWEPVVDGDFLPTNPVTEDSFAEAGRDIPLLIGSNLNEWSGFFGSAPVEETQEQEALAEQISTAWINFARNGVPSADGLPTWEPYTREGGATMILDTEPELVYHHDQALMELLAPEYEY